MLSELDVGKLIEPVVQRQQDIEMWILLKIASVIKDIGSITPSALLSLEQLMRYGSDINQINIMLARHAEMQLQDIERIISIAAKDSYTDTERFYKYTEKDYPRFMDNEEVQKVVESVRRQTQDTYRNISKAQAFMLRDSMNPEVLIPTPLSQVYQSVVDEAIQAAQSGVVDYNTAMQRTQEQLIASGIRRVQYNTESGRTFTQRMDTAVKRNVMDGIRAVNQGVQDITGEQFGADGKELTVHMNPAKDHELVQGHQFTNYEFDKMQRGMTCMDIQGRAYAGFDRAIGTLNCRHFTFSIIIGAFPPNYTDKQLQDILNKNQAGYTLPNGKHLTMYECTQHQRRMETAIRYAREGKKFAEAAGNTKLADKYKAQISSKLKEYEQFSKSCGLKPRFDKTVVK